MGDGKCRDRIKNVLLGFALGTAGLSITLFASSRYELGRAAKLFVFWGSIIALFLAYFAYLVVSEFIRRQGGAAADRRTSSSENAKRGPRSHVQWIRAFILLLSLGLAAVIAYTLRLIYSFGFLASILVGIASFVILNGALTTIEDALMRLLRDQGDERPPTGRSNRW